MEGMKDMDGRKPGPSSILGKFSLSNRVISAGCNGAFSFTLLGVSQLKPGQEGGYRVSYNPEGTGCGAAMRSMCIGLR